MSRCSRCAGFRLLHFGFCWFTCLGQLLAFSGPGGLVSSVCARIQLVSDGNQMKHFVQYHNPDVMGPFRPSQKTFGIVTDKRAGLQEGDTVWLITGEGRPRQYFLCETFVAEKIASEAIHKFRYRVSSTDGKPLYPLKVDKSSDWFQELLRITGNFRYGLQPISSKAVIEGLTRVAAT